MKKNSLAEKNPELAKEWHPTLNGDLTPWDVTCGGIIKVWWLCEKGHEWDTATGVRTRGSGCPYCSGRRAIKGENDLKTLNSDLAKEWHPELNGDLTPGEVTHFSNKSAWWRCSMGHEWESRVSDRAHGNGCPYCAGKKVLKGFNDLATTNPKLAEEWHPSLNEDLTPFDVTSGSGKKVWWQCAKGHDWNAMVASRNKGAGCKQCIAESQTSFPEQAIYYYLSKTLPVAVESRASVCGVEVDAFIPSWHIGVEYDGVYYHNSAVSQAAEKKKNHILAKNGIHLIRIKEVLVDSENSLDVIYCKPVGSYKHLKPALSALAERLSGMTHTAVILDVNVERDMVEIMEQYVESEKARSLAVRNPILAAEWHPTKNGQLTPQNVHAGAGKKVWWKCEKNHEWPATVNHRNHGKGCPYCSGRLVMEGETDLATLNPELIKEWHPTLNGELTPDKVISGSERKVWWQCSKQAEHQWNARINGRSKGSGCPYCSGHRVMPGFNDLETTHPDLAKEWHPLLNGDLTPQNVSSGSNKITWWQCNKHIEHQWDSKVVDRTMGRSCPYCANKRVLSGYNDLASTHPKVAEEWHPILNGDLTPMDVVAGSNIKVWWQCSKSAAHQWKAMINARSKSTCCPYCSNTKVLPGDNDLATTHPELAKEWHPTLNGDLTPRDVVAGSDRAVWWQCEREHEWERPVGGRSGSGSGCPYCSGRNAIIGETDLATTYPLLAEEWHPALNGDLKSIDVVAGSNRKVWWQCAQNHQWKAVIASRKNGYGHCPECKKQRRNRTSIKNDETTAP